MIQPSFLRQEAAERLQQSAYNPKRLVLLHTVVALGCFLLSTLASYLLSLQIAETGGLSGMGLRSALATAQAVLELAVTVGLPFWNVGLMFAALRWVNGQTAGPADLLQGFRRFPSVLGYLLLRGGLFLMLAVGIINISSTLYMLTPFAAPLVDLLTPFLQQNGSAEAILTDTLSSALFKELVPLLLFSAVLFALLAIPLFYRLRFSEFAVMSGLTCGKAMLKSIAVTRKNCLQILKLDLSFWWYYLLLALCILISYGDALLSVLGISLPLSATAASLVFYVLGPACQCVLLWQCEAHRLSTYCLAYRNLAGEDMNDGDTSADEAIESA